MLALLAVAALPAVALEFSHAIVPDFRGWESTTYAAWSDFSNLNADGSRAFPDDPATTATGVRLESAQLGGFTVSGGTLCLANGDRFGIRYNGSGRGRIREIVLQIKAPGAEQSQVFLLYMAGGQSNAMLAAETVDLGQGEHLARFLLAPEGQTLGTLAPVERVVLETALPMIGGQVCIESVRLDVRHALESEFDPGCTSAQSSNLLVAGVDLAGSSVASDNLFELTASGVPAGAFGVFLASETAAMTPCPVDCTATMGTLCLGGRIARIGPPRMASGALVYRTALDLSAIPMVPTAAATAGSTWHFQAWFRDGSPQPTSRFSASTGIVFR